MNFLAHQLLSENDVEFRLGNFLADFVKGKDRARLQGRMRSGLECHRAIDRFTDSHPCVFAAMNLIAPVRRRFAGILVDLFFDYLLAVHWSEYSAIPLHLFSHDIYESFQRFPGDLPPNAERVIKRMIEQDWLCSYGHIAGIDGAIDRIRRVLGNERTEALIDGSADLAANEPAFFEQFRQFFPELREHVENRREQNPFS